MNTENWKFFGDINFMEHPASMVRHAWDKDTRKEYPSLGNQYDVFVIEPDPENENLVIAYMKMIDINDYNLKEEALTEYMQNGYIPTDEFEWAKALAERKGPEPTIDQAYRPSGGMYSALEDFLISKEDAEIWMRDLGIIQDQKKQKKMVCSHCEVTILAGCTDGKCPYCGRTIISEG